MAESKAIVLIRHPIEPCTIIMYLPCRHEYRLPDSVLFDAAKSQQASNELREAHTMCLECLYALNSPAKDESHG